MSILKWVAMLSALWALLALGFLYCRVKGFGKRTLFSPAAGEAREGIRYAFIQGMSPMAKESVRMALSWYAVGVGYHMGVMMALVLWAMSLFDYQLLDGLHEGSSLFAGLGALAGSALLLKRALSPLLRALSSLDDYLSNFLATAFALLAALTGFWPEVDSLWMATSVVLFLYLPLGKIRHCLFFFTTRYHFGAFFGRRGVFPPQ